MGRTLQRKKNGSQRERDSSEVKFVYVSCIHHLLQLTFALTPSEHRVFTYHGSGAVSRVPEGSVTMALLRPSTPPCESQTINRI